MTDRDTLSPFAAYREKHGDHFELSLIEDRTADFEAFGPGTQLTVNGRGATLIQWDPELRILEYVHTDAPVSGLIASRR